MFCAGLIVLKPPCRRQQHYNKSVGLVGHRWSTAWSPLPGNLTCSLRCISPSVYFVLRVFFCLSGPRAPSFYPPGWSFRWTIVVGRTWAQEIIRGPSVVAGRVATWMLVLVWSVHGFLIERSHMGARVPRVLPYGNNGAVLIIPFCSIRLPHFLHVFQVKNIEHIETLRC